MQKKYCSLLLPHSDYGMQHRPNGSHRRHSPKRKSPIVFAKSRMAWTSFASGRRRGVATAKTDAQTAQASGRTRRSGNTPNEAQKQTAQQTNDDLNDALSDLDRSTNRLRRKFDPLDTWMETKAQMQRVMDDGRRINQVMVRGNYGREILGSPAEQYQ